MPDAEREKQLAAEASLSYIESGMVLGLGTGSTAARMVDLVGQEVRAGLEIRAIPTSRQTAERARAVGIPLITLEDSPTIDLTIDGADELDGGLRLIKGGGGALLREKIVAAASDRMIVIADSSKRVETLGTFPLPVEVVPFAWPVVARRLSRSGMSPRLRRAGGGDPFLTDERNYVLDCPFLSIEDPERIAREIGEIPGVVDHGLFLDLADVALVGTGTQVETLRSSTKTD